MSASNKNVLFAFPGQGAQYAGIGKDLFDAFECVKHVYQEASDTLGYDIAKLSFEDPDENINLTRYTQPVLVTHHEACMRVFNEMVDSEVIPVFAAGHSLGEYSALLAAGAIDFPQALTLVSERGKLMGELGRGEMEALALEYKDARVLADAFYCQVAALNMKEQTVVGGLPDDLARLTAAMKEQFPRKRSTRLKTEGAFHTYHMVEAAKQFRTVLDANEFKAPTLSVCSNFTGGLHDKNAASIRSRLFMQLFNPVLWLDNLQLVVDQGVDLIIEFGGGIGRGVTAGEKRANLEGIIKKTFRTHEAPPTHLSVINIASLENTLSNL